MTSRNNETFTVTAEHDGQRVDLWVSAQAGITRSRVRSMMDEGLVLMNGKPAKPSAKVHEGYVVELSFPEPKEESLVAEDIPLEVLYSDKHLVVINKPAGLVVYPAAGHDSGTLMNALLFKFGSLATVGGPLRPGVVHRLDKETSGVMVVALSDEAYYNLVGQFKEKSTQRSYRALINGSPKGDEGEIEAPIGRSISDRKKMSTRTRHGKHALTRWKALMRFPGATLVEARLETGRTHQIRVHFSSIGHSVLGDKTYGRQLRLEYRGRRVSFPRQMLHAYALGFDHPATGERMVFSSELPEDMQSAIEELKAVAGEA